MTATPTGAERPVRNRTPEHLSVRVAGSHLVSPDEQSGVLPSTHEHLEANSRPMVSTLSHQDHTRTTVTANTVGPDSGWPATILDSGRTPSGVARGVTRCTWSLALAGAVLWGVWAASRFSGTPPTVAITAIAATALCGVLLMAAHWITERRPR